MLTALQCQIKLGNDAFRQGLIGACLFQRERHLQRRVHSEIDLPHTAVTQHPLHKILSVAQLSPYQMILIASC
jgi:hypothetical protein